METKEKGTSQEIRDRMIFKGRQMLQMSMHNSKGAYPPPIDLSKKKKVSLASQQHNEQDGRKKGAQAKYLSKNFAACL